MQIESKSAGIAAANALSLISKAFSIIDPADKSSAGRDHYDGSEAVAIPSLLKSILKSPTSVSITSFRH